MKAGYNSIPLLPGDHTGGFTALWVAPREWLIADVAEDFISGVVIGPVSLASGKNFLQLQCIQPSFDFEVIPKANKNGSYYEVKVMGTLNNIIPNIVQTLHTLRYSDLIVVTTDKRKRKRIIGDIESGMFLQIKETNNNKNGGEQKLDIELIMEVETEPFFYIDNSSTPASLNAIYSNYNSSTMAPISVPLSANSYAIPAGTLVETIVVLQPGGSIDNFCIGTASGVDDLVGSCTVNAKGVYPVLNYNVTGSTIYFTNRQSNTQILIYTR